MPFVGPTRSGLEHIAAGLDFDILEPGAGPHQADLALRVRGALLGGHPDARVQHPAGDGAAPVRRPVRHQAERQRHGRAARHGQRSDGPPRGHLRPQRSRPRHHPRHHGHRGAHADVQAAQVHRAVRRLQRPVRVSAGLERLRHHRPLPVPGQPPAPRRDRDHGHDDHPLGEPGSVRARHLRPPLHGPVPLRGARLLRALRRARLQRGVLAAPAGVGRLHGQPRGAEPDPRSSTPRPRPRTRRASPMCSRTPRSAARRR